MIVKGIVTIKKKEDFVKVKSQGKIISTSSFYLSYLCEPESQVIFGFITTRKLGNAVFRNRCRRRIKGGLNMLIFQEKLNLPGGKYIFILKKETFSAEFLRIMKDIEFVLIKINQP